MKKLLVLTSTIMAAITGLIALIIACYLLAPLVLSAAAFGKAVSVVSAVFHAPAWISWTLFLALCPAFLFVVARWTRPRNRRAQLGAALIVIAVMCTIAGVIRQKKEVILDFTRAVASNIRKRLPVIQVDPANTPWFTPDGEARLFVAHSGTDWRFFAGYAGMHDPTSGILLEAVTPEIHEEWLADIEAAKKAAAEKAAADAEHQAAVEQQRAAAQEKLKAAAADEEAKRIAAENARLQSEIEETHNQIDALKEAIRTNSVPAQPQEPMGNPSGFALKTQGEHTEAAPKRENTEDDNQAVVAVAKRLEEQDDAIQKLAAEKSKLQTALETTQEQVGVLQKEIASTKSSGFRSENSNGEVGTEYPGSATNDNDRRSSGVYLSNPAPRWWYLAVDRRAYLISADELKRRIAGGLMPAGSVVAPEGVMFWRPLAFYEESPDCGCN